MFLQNFNKGIRMAKTNGLLKNSLFLYFRMLVLMGIGFFTTRKILEALGVDDLGIYNVVGSLIVMFDFVSSGLSNSTQRFINIGLGKQDEKLTNQYFSQSFFVHLFFAFLITLIAEPVGLWFVKNKLIIPPDRLEAAVIVFHLSMAALIVRLLKICFESDVIAREQMSVYAYLSVFEGVAKLLICYAVIQNNSCDKLIFYAALLLAVNVAVTLFNVFYCVFKYPESRIRLFLEQKVFKELLSFVGINSFGVFSWALGKQGINVVMNMFFGPAINGAKGLAAQLDRVITQFGVNVDTAVRPRITKLYAQNNIEEMLSLAFKSTKYIYYVMLVVSIPILFETKTILSIWLKEVPPFTEMFVKVLVFEQMFDAMGRAFNNVSIATGKIRNIQIYGRLITLSVLPLSFIILKMWPNPMYPVLLMVLLTLAYSLFIAWDVNRNLKFGFGLFVKKSLVPIISVSVVVFFVCIGLGCVLKISNQIVSFGVNCSVYVAVAIATIVAMGMDSDDRKYFVNLIKAKLKK